MYYEQTATGYTLRVRVTPNSSRCAAGGIFTAADGRDYLKINLTAVPEKGKANQELIKFLSKVLGVPKSAFSLLSGDTDRYKRIAVAVLPSAEITTLLDTLEQPT